MITHEMVFEQARYLPTPLIPSPNILCRFSTSFSNRYHPFLVLAMLAVVNHSACFFCQAGLTILEWKGVFEPKCHDTCWNRSFPGFHCSSSKLVLGIVVWSSGNFPSHVAYTPADNADHHVTIQSRGRLSYSPPACSKGF